MYNTESFTSDKELNKFHTVSLKTTIVYLLAPDDPVLYCASLTETYGEATWNIDKISYSYGIKTCTESLILPSK